MLAELTLLVQALQSNDATARLDAAEKLARMGRDAQPAAVALAEATGTDDETRDWAVAALEDLGPPPAESLPALTALLGSDSPDVAYWAATLIGRLQTGAAPAVPALAAALGAKHDPAVHERVAWALGQVGKAAIGAGDALRLAVTSKNPRLSELAREALAKFGG